MSDGQALPNLKLTGVEPGGEQAEFPWVGSDPMVRLALPAGDILRWRMRLDLVRPRIVALDLDWTDDVRWPRLMAEAGADGPSAVFGRIAMMALILVNAARERMGVSELGEDLPAMAVARWCFPVGEVQRLNEAVRIGERAGFLMRVNLSDVATQTNYPKRPERGCSDPNAAGRRPDRSGVDRSRPDNGRACESVKSEDGPDGAGIASPAVRAAAWRSWCNGLRRKLGRPEFLATQDALDFEQALIELAGREARGQAGARDQLEKDLREIARLAEGGGFLHAALRKRGWIR